MRRCSIGIRSIGIWLALAALAPAGCSSGAQLSESAQRALREHVDAERVTEQRKVL